MSIIYRYLNREIFRYFGIILATVICIYLAVDFFEKIDDFMEAHLPVSKVLSFFLFNIPFIVALITPIGLFLAILVAFGLMSKNNEILALKSSGMSIYHLLWPVLSVGLLFTILLFFLSEVIVPITSSKANKIWLNEVRKESTVITREKNIWIKGNRSIAHIKYYNSANQTLHGISLNNFDKDFKLIRRVDAKQAIFTDDRWVFYDGMVQTLDSTGDNYGITFYDEKVEKLDFSPEDFKRVTKKSEEMGFKELYDYTKKVEAEGYDATIYRVDLQYKIAFPFVCIILCVLGAGISFRGKISEGLPAVVAYGIGIAFLYWIFNSFCVSLGYGEVLPPAVAVWIANFIFFCLGMLTLLHAE